MPDMAPGMEPIERDELTGLPNRSAWHLRLKHEVMHAEHTQLPLGIVLIDIDRFQEVNEDLGREAADRVLSDCARLWRRAIRRADCLGRLDGDDFGLLLPDCDSTGAHEVLERVRDVTPDGLTTSMGVAEWQPPESAERLMLRADRALYAAKRQGRDRVASAR